MAESRLKTNLQVGSKRTDNQRHVRGRKHVRLKTVHEEPSLAGIDVFQDNWLVDSPRSIMLEKTTLGFNIPSALLVSLESFYDEVASTSTSDRKAAETKAKYFMASLFPKCRKFGQRIGFRFTRAVYPGSTTDDTQVINARDIDVFMVFEFPIKGAKVDILEPGYRMIPLRKFIENEKKNQYDPWKFGRSRDGSYLSVKVVNKKFYDVVQRAMKFDKEAVLEPYKLQDGRSPVCVRYGDFNIHITPAVFLHAENVFLVTRPYRFDEYVSSDIMWRMSFVIKERKILNLIDTTDRGVRKKAFIALKALVATEHTLHGLSSYQIKTVLFHCFDKEIDTTPRWQRITIETCFVLLLKELHHFLTTKNLPHFYVKGHNLLANMDPKLLYNLTQRLGYIIKNQKELIRILNKRPQTEDEELLPLTQSSRESSCEYFRSHNTEFNRFPGTELTLLGSSSSGSSSRESIGRSKTYIKLPKLKEVTFAERTTVIDSSSSFTCSDSGSFI